MNDKLDHFALAGALAESNANAASEPTRGGKR
jgi:hypothetical protein